MPWRLIVFIVIFAISLTFITFNLGNRCDINFGFVNFKDVPVFLTAFCSFFLGMIFVLPFAAAAKIKRKDKAVKDVEQKPVRKWEKKKEEVPPKSPSKGPYGID